jgi:hypothetical protein
MGRMKAQNRMSIKKIGQLLRYSMPGQSLRSPRMARVQPGFLFRVSHSFTVVDADQLRCDGAPNNSGV